MSYQFSNSEYIRSHGRNPKGTGTWIFAVDEWKQGRPNRIWEFPVYGTLTEAKKLAAAAAKADGVPKYSTIIVCP